MNLETSPLSADRCIQTVQMAEDHEGTKPSCLICKKPNDTYCSRCKSSAYCSPECQKEDWAIHKLLCKNFSEFDQSTRPSPHHFLGFIFPEDQKRPYCDWIFIHKRHVVEDCGSWYEIDRTEYHNSRTGEVNFGGEGMGRRIYLEQDLFLRRRIRDSLSVHYQDSPSRRNRFVEEVRKIRPAAQHVVERHYWPGPLFACCWEVPSVDGYWSDDYVEYLTAEEKEWEKEKIKQDGFRKDLDMNDFRHIVDGFIDL